MRRETAHNAIILKLTRRCRSFLLVHEGVDDDGEHDILEQDCIDHYEREPSDECHELRAYTEIERHELFLNGVEAVQ